MAFLEKLAELRTPSMTGLFSLLTYLGDGMLIVVFALIVYWCIDKKLGLRIGAVVSVNGVINGVLKSLFRVQRPWVKNPEFEAVESAKARASGYSFPSGHMANAVAAYGTAGFYYKNKVVRIILIILIFVIGFSRMYLGVHTPADVIVSLLVSVVVVAAVSGFISKLEKSSEKAMLITVAAMCFIAVSAAIAIRFMPNGGDYDFTLVKDGYLACGMTIGFMMGWYLERTRLGFKTSAPVLVQIAKSAVGLIATLGIYMLFSAFIEMLPSMKEIFYVIKYAVIAFWAVFVYPYIFTKVITKAGKSRLSSK